MIQIMTEWQTDKQLNWTDLNSTDIFKIIFILQVADHNDDNKMLSYRRETALQGEL